MRELKDQMQDRLMTISLKLQQNDISIYNDVCMLMVMSKKLMEMQKEENRIKMLYDSLGEKDCCKRRGL